MTHVDGEALVDPYVEAIGLEIVRLETDVPRPRLDAIYFGGGTPSILLPGQLGRILAAVDSRFAIEQGCEITLEANPGEVDRAKLTGFRAAGVTRLSIGAQSLQDPELTALGRRHSAAEVLRTIAEARPAGFDRLSLDLIYGGPEQTIDTWEETLRQATALQPDHLSLYSLIVEPGTPFARRSRLGRLALPPDDEVAQMYHLACRMLSEAGYRHYEVANWCRPGAECRHNLAYWRNEEFFAAGVGAYDYRRPHRSVRIRGTKRYVEALRQGDGVIGRRDLVDRPSERFETAVMRLRLLQRGLTRKDYANRFGESLDSRYGEALRDLGRLGFLVDDGQAVRLRESMVVLANEAWERFLPEPATPSGG